MSALRSSTRTGLVALRAMLVITAAIGVGYTLAITGIGQVVMPAQANGSVVTNTDGEPVGSALIGQSFSDASGNALLEYFQPRPSAAGDGYDGGASSGSNWGPENADLIDAITERRAAIAAREGVSEDAIPVDAVTASASGLDPHISVAYALLQVPRVAAERGIDTAELRAFVESRIQGRDAGFLGEERINVLELNVALDQQEG